MTERRILLPGDLCPCGSGRALVECCYKQGRVELDANVGVPAFHMGALPQSIVDKIQQDNERRDKFGEIRPLIHMDWQGKKWVAVGEQLYFGSWRFFSDFLQFYIKVVMIPAWGKAELQKPLADRHLVMQWYDGMCRFQQAQARDSAGNMYCVPDGCTNAYLLLAYDLYTLRHHQSLQSVVIDRLKHVDQFQGARYELFVAATCIRAGYDIEFEDEQDSTRKHPEFIATHRKSKAMLSVEAKSRHRPGVLGRPGTAEDPNELRASVDNLLMKAIAKAMHLPHVIFVDVNMPPSEGNAFEKKWFKDVMAAIDRSGTVGEIECAPFNLIVFTNHPFHYVSPGISAPAPEMVSTIPTKPCIPMKDDSEIRAIHFAAEKFGRIPQRFEDAE